MNIFSFNDFESTFKILNLDMTQAEFSGLMEEYGFSNEQIAAVDQVFEYLREKKVRNTIDMYLRTSRLPLKAPRTFENFDFTVIKGKHADRLKTLPGLNAIRAHKNIAFIGPPGTGKTHRTGSRRTSLKCLNCGINSQWPEGMARRHPV